MFAWLYNELKTYAKNIIQHAIPFEENAKPHRQKLRKVNPKLAHLVKKELEKMVEAKITVPIRYLEWLSNPVLSRKKTNNVWVCVDFRNLNAVSKKDNYPLPNMELLLQGSRVIDDVIPRLIFRFQSGCYQE